MRGAFYALSLGGLGGLVGNALEIPLGWLLGAMAANMAANIYGLPTSIPGRLRGLALIVLGLLLGSAFTPELLSRAPSWVVSLAGLVCFLALVVPLSVFYARRVTRLDPVTSIFASIPGGLSEMVMLGWSLGANPRATALAHTSRLATILVVVPLLLRTLADIDVAGAVGPRADGALSARDVLVLSACGVVGPLLAKLLRLPAPMMIGALLASAAAHLSGFTAARPPSELIAAVQVVIGAHIGTAFAGSERYELLRTFALSAGLMLVIIGLAVAFALGLDAITGFGVLALLLALVPGGIAEMGILAFVLNIDPIFVATHHTFRVLLIYLTIPFLARWWFGGGRRGGGPKASDD